MNKKDIFEHIKNLDLTKDTKKLIELIEKHSERVEFVKDGIGLRDVVFISEKGVKEFDETFLYGSFNLDIQFNNDEHNFLEMKSAQLFYFNDIKEAVIDLFEKTDRTLYLWVVTKDSELRSDDMFEVYEEMKKKKIKNPHEAKAKVRKYPKWFNGKFSSEIQEHILLTEQLEKIDKTMQIKLKEDLMRQIDEAIDKEDEFLFSTLSKKYKELNKDLL